MRAVDRTGPTGAAQPEGQTQFYLTPASAPHLDTGLSRCSQAPGPGSAPRSPVVGVCGPSQGPGLTLPLLCQPRAPLRSVPGQKNLVHS